MAPASIANLPSRQICKFLQVHTAEAVAHLRHTRSNCLLLPTVGSTGAQCSGFVGALCGLHKLVVCVLKEGRGVEANGTGRGSRTHRISVLF